MIKIALRKMAKIIISNSLWLLFLLPSMVYAQTPSNLPRHQPEPVNFFESTENIVFYIVIPAVIMVLYILWKRDVARRNREKNNQGND